LNHFPPEPVRHVFHKNRSYRSSEKKNQIQAVFEIELVQPVPFPNRALDPVSGDGGAGFFRDVDSQPRVGQFRTEVTDFKILGPDAGSLEKNPPEIPVTGDPFFSGQRKSFQRLPFFLGGRYRDGERVPSLAPSGRKDLSTVFGLHSFAETVLVQTLSVGGLVGALHGIILDDSLVIASRDAGTKFGYPR
jgi:hypothetical protein